MPGINLLLIASIGAGCLATGVAAAPARNSPAPASAAADVKREFVVAQNSDRGGDIFGFGSVEKIRARVGGSGSSNDTDGLPPPSGFVLFVNAIDAAAAVRGMRWGMTPAQVKASERSSPVFQNGVSIVYRVAGGGSNATITCEFPRGTLSSVKCEIRSPQTDPAAFHKNFEDLTLYFCRVCGVPVTRDYAWTDRTCENDRSKWGLAILKGWLTPRLAWQSTRTRVELSAMPSGGQLLALAQLSSRAGK